MKNEQNTITLLTQAITAPAPKTREQVVDELELSARWADLDHDGGTYWVTLDTAADAVLEALYREVDE